MITHTIERGPGKPEVLSFDEGQAGLCIQAIKYALLRRRPVIDDNAVAAVTALAGGPEGALVNISHEMRILREYADLATKFNEHRVWPTQPVKLSGYEIQLTGESLYKFLRGLNGAAEELRDGTLRWSSHPDMLETVTDGTDAVKTLYAELGSVAALREDVQWTQLPA